MTKLRTTRATEDWVNPEELSAPERLDDVIEAALAGPERRGRRGPGAGGALRRDPSPALPEGLDRRVHQCLACATKSERRGGGDGRNPQVSAANRGERSRMRAAS